MRRVPTEHAEAVALARWMDSRGIVYAHPPNEGKRHPATAAALKAEGMRPGLPDYLLFSPPPSIPDSPGVALELKRQPPAFRPPSISQRRWLDRLASLGWVAIVAKGAQDAVEKLQALGY